MPDKPYTQRIQELAEKWANGSITEDEKQEFIDWYNQFNDEQLQLPAEGFKSAETLKEEMFQAIQQRIHQKNKRIYLPWKRIAVAASILFIVATGSYFLFFNKQTIPSGQQASNSNIPLNDIKAPDATRATLQLDNGEVVYLDSIQKGSLTAQGNVNIGKLADGQIVYTGTDETIRFNTLANPKGSKPVSLKLSDGTMVWLNAASSLRYPVAFHKGQRKVEITGEAYFEVAHDAIKPFFVQKGEMEVQVLGTHFNVNAYDNENNIKVTLLEGSVKVNKGGQSTIIKPGQQARVTWDQQHITTGNADTEQVMAWKNGLFKFNDEDLQTIMKQIERWYNVDVVYEGNLRPLNFGGVISRKENASAVLDLLSLTGVVKFRIENQDNGSTGRIIVML